MKGGGNPPRLAQKVVELRTVSSGVPLMASISVEVRSIVVPVPNAEGGYDQLSFRYSGDMNDHGVEVWTPDEAP